ncbi:hypothetical protein RQP46_011245 [Phenoliferia psychrophenolica]
MPRKSYVIGVGLTAFAKPRGQVAFYELGREAAVKALLDAGINYDEVEQAYCAYNYLGTGCGQKTLYALGMTGIPIFNVNNACASGSNALFLARSAVESGAVECTMALGFEVMAPGPIVSPFKHEPPIQATFDIIAETRPESSGTPNGIIFGNGGQEYCEKYGTTWTQIAAIASKSHGHAANNPYSQFRNRISVDEVLKDKPTTNLAMVTDDTALYDTRSAIELTGSNMTRRAGKAALAKAKLSIEDIGMMEVHDCFAPNELLTYDALGMCAPGKAGDIVDRKDNT